MVRAVCRGQGHYLYLGYGCVSQIHFLGLTMSQRIKLPAQEWLGYDPEKGDIHGYTFEQMREYCSDAELGRILLKYIDRLIDPTPSDPLEVIVESMCKEVLSTIDKVRV